MLEWALGWESQDFPKSVGSKLCWLQNLESLILVPWWTHLAVERDWFPVHQAESSANANTHKESMVLISKCHKPFAGFVEHLPWNLKKRKGRGFVKRVKLLIEFDLIQKWRTNRGEEECASRRTLRDVVCVTVSFWGGGFSTSDESFSLVPESTYKAWIGIRYGYISTSIGSHTYVPIPPEVSFGSKRFSACWCTGFFT